MLTLREKILKAKPVVEKVKVSELGGLEVAIKQLSSADRIELLQTSIDHNKLVEAYRADQALPEDERKGLPEIKEREALQLMLMAGLVDPETIEPIFTADQYDDFNQISFIAISKLTKIFLKLNIVQEEVIEEQKKS